MLVRDAASVAFGGWSGATVLTLGVNISIFFRRPFELLGAIVEWYIGLKVEALPQI